jgi:hypothetical protein
LDGRAGFVFRDLVAVSPIKVGEPAYMPVIRFASEVR